MLLGKLSTRQSKLRQITVGTRDRDAARSGPCDEQSWKILVEHTGTGKSEDDWRTEIDEKWERVA